MLTLPFPLFFLCCIATSIIFLSRAVLSEKNVGLRRNMLARKDSKSCSEDG